MCMNLIPGKSILNLSWSAFCFFCVHTSYVPERCCMPISMCQRSAGYPALQDCLLTIYSIQLNSTFCRGLSLGLHVRQNPIFRIFKSVCIEETDTRNVAPTAVFPHPLLIMVLLFLDQWVHTESSQPAAWVWPLSRESFLVPISRAAP